MDRDHPKGTGSSSCRTGSEWILDCASGLWRCTAAAFRTAPRTDHSGRRARTHIVFPRAGRSEVAVGWLALRFAWVGISIALIAGTVSAQPLPDPEFQLPQALGSGDADRQGPRSRLLGLVRDRSWEEAVHLVEDLPEPTESDPLLQYLSGVVYWQQQDKLTAIQRFRAAERLGLREAYLHKALGLAYHEAHQFLLFEQQMERAIGADRYDPKPHHYLGRHAESVKGDFAGALLHFQKAVSLDPSDSRGHAYLAYCLERLDRRDEATQHFRASIRLMAGDSDRFSWPYQGLARLTLETEPLASVNWARMAVQAEPERPETHALLARAFERNGELAKAVAAAGEAVRLNPDLAATHYLLFTAHRKLGNAEAAQRHISRFRELKRIYGDQ